MVKVVNNFFEKFFKVWTSLGKRATSRMVDLIYLLVTFALLQIIGFVVWTGALYMLLSVK